MSKCVVNGRLGLVLVYVAPHIVVVKPGSLRCFPSGCDQFFDKPSCSLDFWVNKKVDFLVYIFFEFENFLLPEFVEISRFLSRDEVESKS